jgi:hypothetical protein
MSEAPRLCLEARVLVRTGLVLWLVAAAAMVWEVLASQSFESPLRVGVLPGPVGQLRGYAFGLGAVLLAAAWLWPRLYGEGRGRVALGLLGGGALLHTLALVYAAQQGLHAVQLLDPRSDARWVVMLRAAGHLLVSLVIVDAVRRAFKRL